MNWEANDPIAAKRAFNTTKRLRRAGSLEASQAMAGAVVHGFITEAEVLNDLKQIDQEALTAAVASYRDAMAELEAKQNG